MKSFYLFLFFVHFGTSVQSVTAVQTINAELMQWPETHLKLKIATLLSTPFTVMDEKGKLNGFIPELFSLIFESYQNISYEFYVVPGDNFGKQLNNGSWDGLLAEVIEKRVHLAAAALMVTPKRSLAVKFSLPYMLIDIVPIAKKPSNDEDKIPFCYLDQMVKMAASGNMTYGVLKDGFVDILLKKTDNIFFNRMHNLLQQMEKDGREPYPKTFAEAIERTRSNAQYVHHLQKLRSPVTLLHNIFIFRYVFLADNAALDYEAMQRPCDLVVLKNNALTSVYLSFAFPKDIPEKVFNFINMRVIELQRSAVTTRLKHKWWQMSQCQSTKSYTCDKPTAE